MVRIIYDIGANDGADTRFYLAKGFAVVAVEADPLLCAKISATFAGKVAKGVLTVVNVGVSDRRDTMTFFRNAFSEWSSFKADSKATKRHSHEAITVPTAPLSEIIAQHGAPYYLKLDIEGFEKQAISTLTASGALPVYLSFEVNGDWPAILDRLVGLGFDGFQIVRQGKGVLPDAPDPPREGAPWSKPFNNNQSGCFGLDLADRWLDLPGITAATLVENAAGVERAQRGENAGWYDIHARRSAAV